MIQTTRPLTPALLFRFILRSYHYLLQLYNDPRSNHNGTLLCKTRYYDHFIPKPMPFTQPSPFSQCGPKWDRWHSKTWKFNAQCWIRWEKQPTYMWTFHTLFETIAARMPWLFISVVCVSSCSHGDKAGQELCYLCHQRAQKNIPIYFSEERRQRELEQDRLLQQYQRQKNSEAILKEQVLTSSSLMVQLLLFWCNKDHIHNW